MIEWKDLANLLWGLPMQAALLGVGLFLTVRLRFVQVRCLPQAVKAMAPSNGEGISPVAAMTAALGGSLGVGNIIGVTVALREGGPGALLWMILSGWIGMATKYAEVYLAVAHRRREKNGFVGGAMVCLRDRLHRPVLSVLFCVFCIGASLGVGDLMQSCYAVKALCSISLLPPATVGAALALWIWYCMRGGAERVTRVTRILVPVMTVLYALCCLILIGMRIRDLPQVISAVISAAFTPKTAFAGMMGYTVSTALRTGIARGVLSNEAGMGSSAIAHASAHGAQPHRQALLGMAEVFLDTVVMCTLTGLAALLWSGWSTADRGMEQIFAAAFGHGGGILLQVSIALFAVSSILAWTVYGERCVVFLSRRKGLSALYRGAVAAGCLWGAFASPETAFAVSDCMNALMVIPNLYMILSLHRTVS